MDQKAFVVSGWSKNGNGPHDIKHKVNVIGADDSECNSKYRRYKKYVTPSQFCISGDDEGNTCYGDGPVMAMDESKHWHVSGILSYGPSPCGKKGWPDVVTRVSSYKNWIINVCTSDSE